MNNKYCSHCLPTKRKTHIMFHLDYYLSKSLKFFCKPLKYLIKKGEIFYPDTFNRIFFGILSFLHIVRFDSQLDESKIYNRSLIFYKEAKKRNLNIKAIKLLGKYINEFKLVYNNKSYYFEAIPLTILPRSEFDLDDKNNVKKILNKNKIPVAQGKLFTKIDKALQYGKEIGFPLVVKPYNGSLSYHVTCPITSEKDLLEGIKIAKKYIPAFIVERYITGKLFRATVINRQYIFVCQKEKANIIGDGCTSVEDLILQKNNHHYRGEINQKNFTLHKIIIDNVLINNLQKNFLTLKSILPKNKKVYLKDKFVLSLGCDIINCTDIMHAKNKELFLKTANVLNANLIGIDFICPDITQSYETQKTAILETNNLPFIDMHQYPSSGKSEPVAEVVWDVVCKELAKK